MRGDGTRFSTARIVPWGVVMPTVVEPSWRKSQPGRPDIHVLFRDEVEETSSRNKGAAGSRKHGAHLDRFHSVFD